MSILLTYLFLFYTLLTSLLWALNVFLLVVMFLLLVDIAFALRILHYTIM